MILTEPYLLLVVAVVGFLIAGALAPFEALGWWAGWFGQALHESTPPRTYSPNQPASAEERFEHYILFLSGIHSVSQKTFTRREMSLLEHLKKELPRCALIEVFPYSVTNRALTGQRIFAKVWRWSQRRQMRGAWLAGSLIKVRNLWQVAVSADRRYGPIYNQGSAEMILAALKARGYPEGGGVPVTLIGYSGGGQIALGAAPYLKAAVKAPVQVISMGGVMSGDPGVLAIDKLYHLCGEHDWVEKIGPVFFPGRWRILRYSPWNRAKDLGLIEFVSMGPMTHTGKHDYLDHKHSLPDGRNHFEHTAQVITDIIKRHPPLERSPARAPRALT